MPLHRSTFITGSPPILTPRKAALIGRQLPQVIFNNTSDLIVLMLICIPEAPNSPPRKRKAQGPPISSSVTQFTSPPYVRGGSSAPTPVRRRHSRTHSEISSARGAEPYNRPRSRQRPTGSSFGSASGTSSTNPMYDPVLSATSEAQGSQYTTDRLDTRPTRLSIAQDIRPLSRVEHDRRSPERELREIRGHETHASIPRQSAVMRDDRD